MLTADRMERDADGVPIKPLHVQKYQTQAGAISWIVRLHHNERAVTFGSYHSRADAARCADRASIVVHGDLAVLNMPEDVPGEEKEDLQAVSDVIAYACKCRALANQNRKKLFGGVTRT
jgi:hypothetical protein